MNLLKAELLLQALSALAGFLEADDATPERLVVIGGSALIALGIVSRTTRDVDILAGFDTEQGLVDPRPLSQALRTAAEKVALELRLDSNWLNSGPADQVRAGLPEGFLSRLVRQDFGSRLTIFFPDRFDLIHLKLFAIIDQGPGRHVQDLLALKPTKDEILQSTLWVLTQDDGEVFPQMVRQTLYELGHGDVVARI